MIDLLTHEKWPVRLGAMVVVEYLNELHPALSRQLLETLWAVFDQADDAVKGDTLYLFGESGRPEMIAHLDTVANGGYSDTIREAAREVIASLDIPPK